MRGRWSAMSKELLSLGMRVIWLLHLSRHWSSGLIRLTWLVRCVSLFPFLPPCSTCIPPKAVKLRFRWKRTFFGQGYRSSCAPLLEPSDKLSSTICRRKQGSQVSKTRRHCMLPAALIKKKLYTHTHTHTHTHTLFKYMIRFNFVK